VDDFTLVKPEIDSNLARKAINYFAKLVVSLLVQKKGSEAYKKAVSDLTEIRLAAKGWQSQEPSLQQEYKFFKIYGTCLELALSTKMSREEASNFVLFHWARIREHLRNLIPNEASALNEVYQIFSSERL